MKLWERTEAILPHIGRVQDYYLLFEYLDEVFLILLGLELNPGMWVCHIFLCLLL